MAALRYLLKNLNEILALRVGDGDDDEMAKHQLKVSCCGLVDDESHVAP
jgi:hypothetical protein